MTTAPRFVKVLQPIFNVLWHALHRTSQRRALRQAADWAAGVSGV